MTKELKTKWLTALRSDEYEQNFGRLKNVDKPACYCALGLLAVAADLPITDNGVGILKDHVDVGYEPFHELIGQKATKMVFSLNDYNELLFAEIAKWVEKNIGTVD